MTVYSGWSKREYVSEHKKKYVQIWELDNMSDNGVFNYDMVIADIKEQVGDTSQLIIREIEVSVEREATPDELAQRDAENKQRELNYDRSSVKILRERYGNDPMQWPGMT